MSHIAIVYHSGYKHTATLADSVQRGVLRVPGTEVSLVPVDDIDNNWGTLEKADAIIFGSPTYMGSVSAPFKAFMDASSKAWGEQKWKDKVAAGFTNSASMSGDKLNTLVQMMIFAMQHGMIWVGLGLMPGNNSSTGSPDDLNRVGSYIGAMAQSNSDEDADHTPPKSDHETAAHLGERVAKFSSRQKD